jgi:hypothetical protein
MQKSEIIRINFIKRKVKMDYRKFRWKGSKTKYRKDGKITDDYLRRIL